jgi:outer membrane lipoprotein SlyB
MEIGQNLANAIGAVAAAVFGAVAIYAMARWS